MSREELIEKICPTDATYECGQGDCTSNCNDCNELLNALLDEYDKQIREDAIYEYKHKLIDDVSARAKAYEKVNDKHDAEIFNFATKAFIDALMYFDGKLKEKK